MFEVWAPRAESVELQIGPDRHAMTKFAGGWWRADPGIAQGTVDYAYRIDGGPPLPDPRSRWQPRGVEGFSRKVDDAQFPWTDRHFQARPLSSAILYELHVGTFTPLGTFAAAIEKLDHLVDLGVTHVELMPVAQWDGPRGWGYDGVDLYAPHEAYGGPTGLKQLVDACHARGLAVLLDVVYNHLGPRGNYLPQYGPYFTERHHTAWGSAVNYDAAHSDEVRQFVVDNAVMWLRDYHLDGLRLDAVHAIVDTSACHILEELAARVDQLEAQLGRHLVVTAESDLNDPRLVRSREAGGYGLDAQWSDDIHHALHAVLTGERTGYYGDFGSLEQLSGALRSPYVFAGEHSQFRKRRHGRSPVGLDGGRFIAFLQNHDQVGNRAQGDRLCHLVDRERAKVGAALLLTSAYIPLLFQGEEWAASSPFQYFTSFQDAELGRAVRQGRRREFVAFGWRPDDVPDPQDPATFARSKLRWEEVSEPAHADMLSWYRRLIALRRRSSWIMDRRLELVHTRFDGAQRWICVERGPITVACNLNAAAGRIPLARERPSNVLLCSNEPLGVGGGQIELPPDSVAILGPECR